jgi:hypothetical protein
MQAYGHGVYEPRRIDAAQTNVEIVNKRGARPSLACFRDRLSAMNLQGRLIFYDKLLKDNSF